MKVYEERLKSNVQRFLDETLEGVAEICSERFGCKLTCELDHLENGSPIEDIFYIAFSYKCFEFEYEINPSPDYCNRSKGIFYPDGIYVYPQHKVGKYRVDFLINHQHRDESQQIIVELDGHEFHDKNKKQRAYEKARDRYLAQQGYKIFHYTGSEVYSDPYGVAEEVLKEITKYKPTGFGGFE